MKRVIEEEIMDDEAQALAYAEADFEKPHSMFMSLFQDEFGLRGGTVLDIGCGPGDITLRFARACRRCIVHGIDASEAMLCCGRKNLAGVGDIQGRIQLIRGKIPGCKLPRTKYDIIISNSLLHHLPDPQALWDTVRRYGVKGTPVFVMDLKRPDTAEGAAALMEKHAAGEPEILRRDFYNSLLAAFDVEEVQSQVKKAGFEMLSVRVVSDRHLVISGCL